MVADVAGLPRRRVGRLGLLSSGDDVAAGDAGALLAEDDDEDAVVSAGAAEEVSEEGFFNVGRSEGSSGLGAVLPPEGFVLPDGAVCEEPELLDVSEPEEPLDPAARCSTGRSSAGSSMGFGLGCLAACCASFLSNGSSGFQRPVPTQLPLTCSGVVTVKSPVGSP